MLFDVWYFLRRELFHLSRNRVSFYRNPQSHRSADVNVERDVPRPIAYVDVDARHVKEDGIVLQHAAKGDT